VECNGKLIVCLVSLFTGLFLTRSTTGYVALAFIVLVTVFLYLKKAVIPPKVRLFRNCLAVALLFGVVIGFLLPDVRAQVSDLLDKVVFKKTKSESYEERTAWNQSALMAGAQSHWVGAGWGSLRASSLVANILGTVGIPGLFLFMSFCFLDMRFAVKSDTPTSLMQKSAVLPILVSLLDCVLAGPEMTDPVVWFLFGVAAFVDPKSIGLASQPVLPLEIPTRRKTFANS
jgi:O-antigen ligase